MDMTDLVLIKASDKDLAFLMHLRKATMTEHLEVMGLFLTEAEHLERVRERFECAHVVVSAGRRIGMLKYTETVDSIEILQVQILPSLQGSGIGSRLIRLLAEDARHKAKHLSLTVLKANSAGKLYERLGFTIVGEDVHEFRMELSAEQLQSG